MTRAEVQLVQSVYGNGFGLNEDNLDDFVHYFDSETDLETAYQDFYPAYNVANNSSNTNSNLDNSRRRESLSVDHELNSSNSTDAINSNSSNPNNGSSYEYDEQDYTAQDLPGDRRNKMNASLEILNVTQFFYDKAFSYKLNM